MIALHEKLKGPLMSLQFILKGTWTCEQKFMTIHPSAAETFQSGPNSSQDFQIIGFSCVWIFLCVCVCFFFQGCDFTKPFSQNAAVNVAFSLRESWCVLSSGCCIWNISRTFRRRTVSLPCGSLRASSGLTSDRIFSHRCCRCAASHLCVSSCEVSSYWTTCTLFHIICNSAVSLLYGFLYVLSILPCERIFSNRCRILTTF